MSVSQKDIERACEIGHRAHLRLLWALRDLVVADRLVVDGPTRLPGWTRSMLITHLARNADSHRHMIDGAAAGEEWQQYDGGMRERDGAIEAGRDAGADDVLADLTAAITLLEAAWDRTDWSGHGLRGPDRRTPIAELPFLRVREVELHHVDLDIGYTFDDVDRTYVRLENSRMAMLWTARQPMGMTTLPDEVLELSPSERLAWFTGRHEVEGLPTAQLL